MKRTDFLKQLKSPLPNAVLKKYPNGNIMQLWGENPTIYSAAFGQHDDVHRYLGGHSGIDIATAYGDPVCAAHDGEIGGIDRDPTHAAGITVKVVSNPLDGEIPGNSKVETLYCHLKDVAVVVGQRVKQGDVIGHEGNTGFVTSGSVAFWGNAPTDKGTHLHFGLHELILHTVGGVSAWTARYNNPLMGTTDPLPYLTRDLSGLAGVLRNLAAYLRTFRSS